MPISPLYKYVLENNLYEYIDDIGLLYLPGFDIKTRFFYGKDSKDFVDFDFKKRTTYDRRLFCLAKKRTLKKNFRKNLSKVSPAFIKNAIKDRIF
jgi:hypothetical protein